MFFYFAVVALGSFCSLLIYKFYSKLFSNEIIYQRVTPTVNHLDEARYGRACILILNICPFTLRHVIKDYYTRHGYLSLQDFLEKHKHDLYHLWQKSCCCRSRQSRSTLMNKSQWDLLYIRNTSSCTKGHSGDCPCLFNAKPGATPDTMDVTLCCLVISNLCKGSTSDPGINIAHIQTIREVRNKLVHAQCAFLDQATSYDYWNRVKTAITDLANNVSRFIYTDTLGRIRELETRVMNTEELGELRKLIVDQKRIENLDERVSQLEESENIKERVEESDVNRLKEKCVELNYTETEEIPLSPVQDDSDKLPIEQMFSPVVIKEDSRETRGYKAINKLKTTHKNEDHKEQKEVKTPMDLLMKDGKPVDNIYMLGDAAHGKTTYCLWLLKMWCNSQQPSMDGRALNEWENALSQFEFVFHLPLRHVDPSRASVIDMICQDIFGRDNALQKVAKYVLSDDKYRCFIIIDGLDEWKPNESALNKLKYKGIPNIDSMSNCVVFTTMRSWVYSEMAKFVKSDDRLIEIKGLDQKGIETVIGNVLEYYEMRPSSGEYKTMHKEITGKLRDKTIASLVKIPLMAVVCVQIWCSGDQVGDSMTNFYVAMVNMMIQRAHLKHNTQAYVFDSIDLNLPELLSSMKNIKNNFKVLFNLGKVAYEALLSNESKLVFPKDELENKIGEEELRFALDVGLIAQRGANSVMDKMVSVNFFHKSVQEFLAAIYTVTENHMIDSFCEHLSNIKVIMELSTVIMFICGLCPPLGSVVSQRVVNVTDNNKDICEYRGTVRLGNNSIIAYELYKQQVSWYQEVKKRQPQIPVAFHISDVCFYGYNTETIPIARDLLSDPLVTIRSLKLPYQSSYEDSISDAQCRVFLSNKDNTRSLVMLSLLCLQSNGISVYKICGPSLRTIHLDQVRIKLYDNDNTICPPLLSNMSQLRILYLRDVALGDRLLGLTPDMTHLESISFSNVNMSTFGWRKFVSSLIDVEHEYKVRMFQVDIDEESIKMIRSSRHFSPPPHLNSIFESDPMFIRVWPPLT